LRCTAVRHAGNAMLMKMAVIVIATSSAAIA
jgi:hypothetical protein